jgi:dihydrolipoamide dehydrogenase
MSQLLEVIVPDIGEFSEVEIIEVHVKAGDKVAVEESLITLESDKAAMEVPSPAAGTIEDVAVSLGDKVSEGTLILRLATEAPVAEDGVQEAPAEEAAPNSDASTAADRAPAESAPAAIIASDYEGTVDAETGLLVLGSGPGGYTAAFRAADLGLEVTLVERYPDIGGVCLNVGCIPSKALLHAAKVIDEADDMAECGIQFAKPEIDTSALRGWKEKVVGRLTGGLQTLAKQRKVKVVTGTGEFVSPHHVRVTNGDSSQVIAFRQCIIAAGSQPVKIPGWPEDPRIVDSTGALEIPDLPERMLVVGGGIIGLEMATVYCALGVEVSVVELMDQLIPGCDKDLVRPLTKRITKRYGKIMTGTKVTGMVAGKDGIKVSFDGKNAIEDQTYGLVLVAVGRAPNGAKIGADKAGVAVDERGFIAVDKQMLTNVPHIFAIGDIVGQPMLAHKATHEGKVAAEVAAGHKRAFDARVIPSVAYTDPEIAWVGVTETEAKAQGIDYGKGVFPWAASGRSLSLNRDEGVTKLLFDPATKRVIGAGIVGPNAGDLIAEVALAIEMGCDAEDIGLTVHPHPTLSETVAMAAEAFDGTLTDLYIPKRK